MFGISRSKKKPANKAIRTATSSSDDDEEEEHRRRNLAKKRDKKSKQKKMKIGASASAAGLSFDPEEEGRDVGNLLDVTSSSKKRKKHSKHSSKKSSKKGKRGSGGFGYGGGMAVQSEESSDAEQNLHEITSSQYDAATLQKLKMEQKHVGKIDRGSSNDTKHKEVEQQDENNKEHSAHVENEEEFIPLSDSKAKQDRIDPVVLTGDEALAFVENEEGEDTSEFDHGLKPQPQQTKPETAEVVNEQMEEEVEEGNRQWEDTMARRAGVLRSGGTSNQGDSRHHGRNKVTSTFSSIDEIKSSLQPTINNLENVSSDLATNIHRQQSAITSTKDDLAKHQNTLQDHGKALEYYQGLRVDLATWMGALRELDSMISLAEDAQRLWEVDVSREKLERFFEWGEDCKIVLERHSLLESTPGGDDFEVGQAPEVDEFGRVVSSKATIARIKRLDRRRKVRSQRLKSVDDSDMTSSYNIEDNFDELEIDEWKQRYKALSDAVVLIPNSVKEDYRSITNLCSIFVEWQRLYPDDCKTSFAELSLVKMACVLVRLELSQRWDLLGLSRSIGHESQLQVTEISEFEWFKFFKGNSTASLTQGVVLQIIEKECCARLLRSFTFYDETGAEGDAKFYGVYNPFSVDQTKHLCTFLKSILVYMSTVETDTNEIRDKIIQSVSSALLSLVRKCIERMKVPLLNTSNIKRDKNTFVTRDEAIEFDNEANDAIAYASVVQAKELCALASNMLQFWHPIIYDKDEELLKFVFTEVISQRMIPVVQTLQNIWNECSCDLSKTLIVNVLEAASGLLDEQEWMLHAAPLRVAAQTVASIK